MISTGCPSAPCESVERDQVGLRPPSRISSIHPTLQTTVCVYNIMYKYYIRGINQERLLPRHAVLVEHHPRIPDACTPRSRVLICYVIATVIYSGHLYIILYTCVVGYGFMVYIYIHIKHNCRYIPDIPLLCIHTYMVYYNII